MPEIGEQTTGGSPSSHAPAGEPPPVTARPPSGRVLSLGVDVLGLAVAVIALAAQIADSEKPLIVIGVVFVVVLAMLAATAKSRGWNLRRIFDVIRNVLVLVVVAGVWAVAVAPRATHSPTALPMGPATATPGSTAMTPGSTTGPAPPVPRIQVAVVEPRPGAAVERCLLDVRFTGEPRTGYSFVVATVQQQANYYFESLVRQEQSGVWLATVQVGERDLTTDENYDVQVYELPQDWARYLGTVMQTPQTRDATWWTSAGLPPGTQAALASVPVTRTKADPTCPT